MSLENCISLQIQFCSHLSFLCFFFHPALFFLSVMLTHTFLPHTDTVCSLVPSCTPFLSELPAKSLDLAAINLTELVNGMLSTALRGTKKLFSLLSVTSYSSFAFHKVSVTIYNLSNTKNIDPGKFPMHYCYCLNNVTNDLTDFTALLVDIIGNSTSYLTEIFKSTSILSVRQSNDSDCIYICVMAGQTGKNLSDFLEILEKSPVINYTFSSNTSSDLGEYMLGNKRKQEPECGRARSGECQVSVLAESCVFSPGCPQALLREPRVTSPPVTLIVQKINPCVMELCRFFQLCLCVGHRRYSRKEAMRYCVEYYSWFVKNASYVCETVKRVAYSHTLKQKCLKNICTSV
uniref:HERV-H LTR-associating 1 n=1 Tax=Catharus ustulatus TaxID=91951 RepID=A0A8C3Y482_CATUS